MKKLILLVLFSIGAVINVKAQEIDSLHIESLNARIEELSSKLNDLQNDYEFLLIDHELKTRRLELKTYINEIKIQINKITINIQSGKYNAELYYSFKGNYDLYIEEIDSIKELVNSTILLAEIKIGNSDFTDLEVKVLESEINICKDSVTFIEDYLYNYKTFIDLYRKLRLY